MQYMYKFKRFLLSCYWLVPIIILALLICFFSTDTLNKADESLWLALIATGFSWTYFFQKQKLEEDKLFLEYFEKFNKRFHELSDALQAIIANDNSQTSVVLKPVIHKYFDLCLEEYQLYKRGRIPEKTWRYWAQGMHHYLQFQSMRQYWEKMESEKLDDGLTIAYLEKLLDKPVDQVVT